ncbi:hypothetical protein BLNAU_265 [Blattamonas nauphoetae]|uniref:Uncharacterized protein n=1 Tax=Blattamonas nauphoetae TaxID=2049346 RepID=A0ABQ9YMH8_9EUKA|nr:hypothetical protein BLNAU_265 [Blattamonas nauphoetae]
MTNSLSLSDMSPVPVEQMEETLIRELPREISQHPLYRQEVTLLAEQRQNKLRLINLMENYHKHALDKQYRSEVKCANDMFTDNCQQIIRDALHTAEKRRDALLLLRSELISQQTGSFV